MELRSIDKDGTFAWPCHTSDCDFHDDLLTAHISHSTVQYQRPSRGEVARRLPIDAKRRWRASGAVIALPPCLDCGSQTFLKADFVPRDLLYDNVFLRWQDELGDHGYLVRPSLMRSFRLIAMLHEIGKFPEQPLLPMIPVSALARSPLAELSLTQVDKLWLRWLLTGKRCLPELSWIDDAFHEIAPNFRPFSIDPRKALQ